MKLFYYIKRFWEISRLEKRIFIKGILFSLAYCLLVALIPLKFYSKILFSSPKIPGPILDNYLYIKLVTKTIRRIERFAFWDCNCLNKVLISKHLYKDFGIFTQICFSIYGSSDGLKGAHASILVENSVHVFNDKTNSHCNKNNRLLL
jgi:hypothetical protein